MVEKNKFLEVYEQVREVPQNALKPISSGRLKGKSDINPMWRIKKLTETFGMCGFGWRYDIVRMWTEPGAKGEISAFVHINLFVKYNGEWSEAIQGVGGSSFVANERSGLYTSDECFKMALTDAISVSCKALGMAADVYFESDRTKYDSPQEQPQEQQQDSRKVLPIDMFGNEKVMSWLHKNEMEARSKGLRISLSTLLENNYKNCKDDIRVILENYENYKINNNLQ